MSYNFLTINYNIYSAYYYLMTCIICIVDTEKGISIPNENTV